MFLVIRISGVQLMIRGIIRRKLRKNNNNINNRIGIGISKDK